MKFKQALNLSSINKNKFLKSFIGAFPFLKKERGGLSASIFSKKKRIYASIPNAAFTNEWAFAGVYRTLAKNKIV